MSQRGRGSGSDDDDPDASEAERERLSGYSFSRPIQPYDPYRKSSDDAGRPLTRNVAASGNEASRRARSQDDDPYPLADDPLSAEAWDFTYDEVDGELFAEPGSADQLDLDDDLPPPPRRERRQPTSRASGRHAESGAARRAPRRAAAAAPGARERQPRGGITIGAPRAVTDASLVADPIALLLLGINLLSLVIMTLLLGLRLGSIPSPTVLRLDAAGNPDRWGSPTLLWRLPLMSFFLTAMCLIVSWFLHPIDRFAARFVLGIAIVAQAVAWVAVLQHLLG